MDRSERELRAQQARNSVLQERDRIAHDLHDGISQSLFFLNVQLKEVDQGLGKRPESELRVPLSQARKVTGELFERIRQTIFDLKATEALEQPTFCSTVRRYIDEFSDRFDIPIHVVNIDHTCKPDCPEAELHLLRIIQEALLNARKHANPTEVRIELTSNARSDELVVSDDGCGFDPSNVPGIDEGHFGLSMMRERAQRLGGNIWIDSKPGTGTTIRFKRPAQGGTRAE